ncbi:alpha/beta fold hydrolase [Microbacterium murale]|uniref:Pimeloyl-ACP methyl ester carboxylesterase n=1 Tax=Microbacterium murale TaxID=1081040 RepID=A0ABU0PAP4_9MICO|nr:alpha/beta hydrolase [Microbacterium murale]MDQ0644401.1 pimeloyl-ACP methyl ester carboxylesterase [Microbacterium murale]
MKITTATLDVADARLHYEVRGDGPLIALIGAPMDAEPFNGLADALASDHTVLTADPRGIRRSTLLDSTADSTAEQRANDLAALVRHVDAGAAIVLGSSGGAVTALAFAQDHPELTATVIAHEPPLITLLDDAAGQRRMTEEMIAVYGSGDVVGAWERFFRQATIDVPPGMLQEIFGGDRDPQTVADEAYWFFHEYRASVYWAPRVDLLRAGAPIIVGIGAESAGQLCERTATALADLLDIAPERFPGDHTGFVEHPAEFAERLRRVTA